MLHPPAEFPLWATLSVCTTPPWVTSSNKSSHRHAIHCGLVGLALALGGFLISLQHFFHTPNLFQLPLKTTLHATHSGMHIPYWSQACFVHHWNVHVECCLWLHPTCTMRTMPIHEVPTYAHWPSSHPSMVGAPLCAHHTPPINLWQYSTLQPQPHTCSEPGCTATFGCACPSMFPIAWRNFHHKPALVAPFILWLEYLLCAHHTHFPIFQLPGTHVDPLFLPTWPLHSLHTTLCTLLCTSAHLCAPSHTPAHLCASPFLGLSPLSDFPLTSDPLLATMGNPALVQPGTAPIPDLCITKSNPCG